MNPITRCVIGGAAFALALPAVAQITFYEKVNFNGRAFTTDRTIPNLEEVGYNDRASSVAVDQGRWEVCDEKGFQGRCVVLRQGYYDGLRLLGFDKRISSVRPVDPTRKYENEVRAPVVAPEYIDRKRSNERLFEAPVISVRAIMGAPDERCWVQTGVYGQRRDRAPDGPFAGAVGGGLVVNREAGTFARNLRHCASPQQGDPAYWDVTYVHNGVEHYAQMTAPPGETILVTKEGFPRGSPPA